MEFYKKPRPGEVYNIGGGRANSLSILETIALLKDMGLTLKHRIIAQNRVGDHICYITDLTKVKSHFPDWRIKYDLAGIIEEMRSGMAEKKKARAR
jgi:CDP-paratose 2-epimerase